MTAKRVVISPTKAIRVEAVQVGEFQGISLRQMYATKKDKEFKPAKQGIIIPLEVAAKIAKHIAAMVSSGDTEFVVIEHPTSNKD